MSLITCCPACGTKFRVVADQLRISDGWVRCGRCQEVFDAQLALQKVTPAVTHGPSSAQPPVQSPVLPVPPAAAADSDPTAMSAVARVRARSQPPLSTPPAPIQTASQPAVAVKAAAPTVAQSPALAQAALDADTTGQWEVLPSQPTKPQPVVRDLRAAPAPDLPAVEVVQGVQPLSSTPALAPAQGKDVEPALDDGDAPWDVGVLDFPEAGAATQPVPEAVEAMAQAFAEEMEAGGALGLGARAAAPLAPVQELPAPQPPRAAPVAAVDDDAWLHESEQRVEAPEAPGAPNAEVLPPPPPPPPAPPAPATELLHILPELEGDAAAQAPIGEAASEQEGHAAEELQPAVGPAVPEFMKQAQRKAWWSQPAVRFVMGMLVMLLPLALALQIVVQERNALAAWQPAWRPALENLCVALGCTLAPRQDIAAVVVSDSHFAATGAPFAYQLEVALHNRSGAAVAMPALEVTLTDSQEQVLVRKVLQPQDLGAPTELGPRAEWSAKLPVTTQGLHLPVSGYRLTVFYP